MAWSKLKAALAWAERGFRVFPLEPNGKEPVVSAFGSVASSDPTVINAWWHDPVLGTERDYNIGVLTTDIVVCDVDVKDGKPGLDTYYAMGGHFETLVVQTPTGGYHCYFNGQDSANTYPGPGLDIRSHNGYVLAPGSTINGKPYTVVSNKPMAWVPGVIEGALRPPGRRLDRNESDVEFDAPNSVVHAQAWLDTSAPLAVEGMGGDHTTYAVACKLVRDFALTEETAFELLRRHWNDRCTPPWDAEGLWRKVENAHAYGTSNLGVALPEVAFGGMVDIPEVQQFVPPVGLDFGNARDVGSIPQRPWLVPRLLMRRAVTMLVAQGAGGKTTLMLAIAAHGAVAKDLWPYRFSAPFKSIIVAAEEDRDELSRRLIAICAQYELDYAVVKSKVLLIGSDDIDAMGGICVAGVANRQPYTNAPQVDWLISLASAPDVGMMGLDPLVEVHLCDEQDNAQMKFVMGVLRRIARDANVALFVPHHTPKGGKEAGNADAARGAGAIVNSARIALTLFGTTDQDRTKYGIKEEDKWRYVRLDDAKSNNAAPTQHTVWFKKEGVKLYNGDEVGVLYLHDMVNDEEGTKRFIALTLAEALGAKGSGAMSMAEAVIVMKNADPLYERMPDATLRARIENVTMNGVTVDAGLVVCEREKQGATEKIWIKLM